MSSSLSAPEACPPPLMWQDVRREYLAQSEYRLVKTSVGTVSVRILGSGPPLYLLPAFAAPAELDCLLIWLLREEFRCVTVEPAPVESGDSSPSCRTMADYVSLLLAAADELGDEQIMVFGANFGAAWGLAAAHQAPRRIARLMLLEGFAYRRLSMGERQLAWLCGWTRRTLSDFPFRGAFQEQNHRRWFPPFDGSRWQYYLDATGGMPLRELSRRARAVAKFDLRSALNTIAAPTLLIRTEGEGSVAAACQVELEQALRNVAVEWLHSTGQLAYLTHPHRLAKLIRSQRQETRDESQEPERIGRASGSNA